MKKIHFLQGLKRLGAQLLGGALLAGTLAVLSSSMVLAAGPVNGTSCTPSCDLWAETGTMPSASLPGAPAAGIPVWGYNTSNAAVAAPSGPVLIVNQGDAVSIVLHNANIPGATSLSISGQAIVPDSVGVTAGNSTTYSFPAGFQPGTYLYEAGLTANGPRQAAMGLYGALIVRPAGAANQAYASAATAFNDEAVLVLSEIDPAFNAAMTAALPFDMGEFAAKYFLINGKVYPNTDPIVSAAGSKVLLRYVNAGIVHHSMATSGIHQTIYAVDAALRANPMKVVAQTVPTGTTLDTIVTMPAVTNAKYAVFDAANHLDNGGATTTGGLVNFGGMLTFITSGSTATNGGPVTSAVTASPNPATGAAAVALSATFTSSSSTVTAGEYFIDAIGAPGTGTSFTGTYGSASVSGSATLSTAVLAGLASGNHTIYVRGEDALNVWGAVSSTVLNLDRAGPSTGSMSLTPNLTNGTGTLSLQATGSDVSTGNQNVVAAEYFIDSQPVSSVRGTLVQVSLPATSVSETATIPSPTSEGSHAISVRSQDALGNWGPFGAITVNVDKTAPNTSGVVINPSPNNGTLGVQVSSGGAFYLRIDATLTDPVSNLVSSKIAAAEYFINTVGANGSGGAMIPTDGAFDNSTELAYGAVDLMNIANLAPGSYTVYVHAKDAAGNWGAFGTSTLIIDKAAPTVSAATLVPVASNNTAVVISASGNDTATGNSNIVGGEYYIDTVGAAGTGTAMTAAAPAPTATFSATIPSATIAGLSVGNHTINVRSKDAAGNWSTTTASATLLIDRTAPTFTGIAISPTSILAGTASVTLNVNGATDGAGGSGVAGGEYWFGTTNITAGTGTAFNGTSGIAVNTSALTAGTYTLRVRIRDVAGNWSAGNNGVRTATLTVTGPVLNRPTVSLVFAGTVTGGNGTQTQRTTILTITLSNSNGVNLTGVGLIDNLPQPAPGTLTYVALSATTTCGGTVSTTNNNNRRLVLTGGAIPANGSCTVKVTVRLSAAAPAGPYTLTNTIAVGGVTSGNGGSNSAAASAVLSVTP